jgi:ketosteroid isomerase-like protein
MGGKVSTKPELIAMAKAGDTKMEIGRSEDVKVRLYGDTAIVTCRWIEKSTTKGKPFEGTQILTTVWVKNNGTWRIVSDQGTLVTP